MNEYDTAPMQNLTEESNPKYELDQDFSLSKEYIMKEFTPKKITLYSVNLREIKNNYAPAANENIHAEKKNRRINRNSLDRELTITDFDLFKVSPSSARNISQSKPKLPSLGTSIYQFASPSNNKNLFPSSVKRCDTELHAIPELIDSSIHPEGPHKISYSTKTILNPRRNIEVIGGGDAITSSIKKLRQNPDHTPMFPTIHSTILNSPTKLTSSLKQRHIMRSGYLVTRVNNVNKIKINLNDCVKPIVDPSQKKMLKALGSMVKK
jgi:hypothetical protein